MSNRPENKNDEDHLLDLNFVPKWARQEPGENPYIRFEGSDQRQGARRGRREFGGRMPHRDDDRQGGRHVDRDRRVKRPGAGSEDRPAREPATASIGTSAAASQRRPRLPVRVSFLPERKGLGVIVRKIHHSVKAYALPDVAALFLSKPPYHLVKVEFDTSADAALELFQCRICAMIFLDREKAVKHLLSQHMDHYFEIIEVETEPPSGNFTCIARCTLSGELIAPPNHHSYVEKVNALHAAHFAQMSLEDYKKRIETLHDQELIEQWKQESSRQRRYHLKAAKDSEPMKESEARTYILQHLAGEAIRKGTRFVIPAVVAREMEDGPLRMAISDQWVHETRFPTTMIYALRPALRHMKLHLFKGSDRETFVTAVKPSPVKPEQAVSSICEALHYLESHPGCTREDLVAHLACGAQATDEKARPVINNLTWLIEKGHVIEFHDGRLSVPMSRNRARLPE